MKTVFLLIMMLANNVYARCSCVCINGENASICTDNMELPPLCTNLCSGVDLSGNEEN